MRRRRDPRAERLSRTIPGTERFRLTLSAVAAAPARLRRNPRAARRAATIGTAPRPRIAWMAGPASPAQAREPVVHAPAEQQIRIIAEPSFVVLAVPDFVDEALSPHDRQLIGAGRLLADGGGAVMVVAPSAASGLGEAGADRLAALPEELWSRYDPEGRAAATCAAIRKFAPRHVLFAESAEGGDLARRVAALLGEPLFAGAEGLAGGRLFRRMRGGRSEQLAAPPRLISIAEHAFGPHDGPPHEARLLDAPAFTAQRHIEKASPLRPDADLIPLAEADFILSGGNGVTDWAAFTGLARALGATPGGSRAVCDAGHLPRDRQIGASGTLVSARCYFALGISGAPQHLQGLTEVEHVIAVNTDLHAEMIKRSDLAIIADAQSLMPALIRLLRERADD